MDRLALRSVFTAGGIPTVTYVPREEKDAETKIDRYLLTGNTILSISGPSKSGKTVLCRRKIPDGKRVDVAGGQTRDLSSFWHQIADVLQLPRQASITSNNVTNVHLHGKAGGTATIPGIGELSLGGKADRTTTNHSGHTETRDFDMATSTLNALVASGRTLVIDDFHFIPPQVQADIVQALKQKILVGLNVVVLSVPHRGFDPARAERDINQRLQRCEIPAWTVKELEKIALGGFSALNLDVSPQLVGQMAAEAYGSPILMQRFCQELCLQNNVLETLDQRTRIGTKQLDKLLTDLAKEQPADLHEKIARGQGRAGDRPLKDGSKADIYEIVLRAIVDNLPKTTISLDEIRENVRRIVVTAPQNHEVTRVLKKISEIAALERSGDAVIEWDEVNRKLHIADPSFAFYLKWGYFEGRSTRRS